MRVDDVGLDLQADLEKPVTHLLELWEIIRQGAETIAEKTLDIALAVEFVMASTIANRQTDPVYGIAFSEKGVVLRCEKAGDPAQRAGLHSFNGIVESLFDGAIQNAGIFEGHIQSLMPHELLQGRLANAIVKQRNSKCVPVAMRSQSLNV